MRTLLYLSESQMDLIRSFSSFLQCVPHQWLRIPMSRSLISFGSEQTPVRGCVVRRNSSPAADVFWTLRTDLDRTKWKWAQCINWRPFPVSRYFCAGLFGLSGMVRSRYPWERAGFR